MTAAILVLASSYNLRWYLLSRIEISARAACSSSRRTFFVFMDTAPTEIYTLSLHDALPICDRGFPSTVEPMSSTSFGKSIVIEYFFLRSEEHTSELQSQFHLVCRLLLE